MQGSLFIVRIHDIKIFIKILPDLTQQSPCKTNKGMKPGQFKQALLHKSFFNCQINSMINPTRRSLLYTL